MTTAELIQKLQELDPSGTKHVACLREVDNMHADIDKIKLHAYSNMHKYEHVIIEPTKSLKLKNGS